MQSKGICSKQEKAKKIPTIYQQRWIHTRTIHTGLVYLPQFAEEGRESSLLQFVIFFFPQLFYIYIYMIVYIYPPPHLLFY